MENINKLSIKKTTDLFFFIICIIFIVLCSQLLLSLLKPIFYGENIRSLNLLFLSVFTIILYKFLDIFAIKIKISKKILRYLLVFIFLLTIIKLTSDSKSLEILIDVIILDFGAIYIISEIVKRYEIGSLEFLGLIKFKLSKFKYIGFYFFAWPAIILWSQIIEYLNLDFFQNSNYSEEIFISLDNNYLIIFIMACIVAPICEEIIFRGFIFKVILEKINLFYAIIINSIFFGLIHFEPSTIIPASILGVSLTLIRYKSESLLLAIIIHALHNLLAFIVTYLTL